jgi:hypothetical protein
MYAILTKTENPNDSGRTNMTAKSTRTLSQRQRHPELELTLPAGSITYVGRQPTKRQRSSTNQVPLTQATTRPSRRPRQHSLEATATQIRVNDRDRLERWFREAFLAMQQVACRLVAKIWIKKIHPKKARTISLPSR